MKSSPAGFTSTDEYIATFPDDIQKILQEVRATIKAAAPDAKEKISYQMPTFDLKGNLVHFAAFKNHIGFYPTPSGTEAFKDEIARYQGDKGSIRFPLSEPMPLDLITQIVKMRMAENLRKAEGKARKKEKGQLKLDYDPLEGYHDAQAYDRQDGGYDADVPLTQQLARTFGSPMLDIACGTGTMALRLATQGYAVTGVDIVPEMIALARQKAAAQGASVEWVVADARDFHLQKQFPFIYMLGNAFQHFLTREDHEALFAHVREHLHPAGCFLFVTRNPVPKNLFEARFAEPQRTVLDDGTLLTETEEQQYNPITQIQHYTFYNHWLRPDGRQEEKTYRTALRYVFPQEMKALLYYNGFTIQACYGSWQQEPLTADSRSMIYVCQKRG